MMTYSWKSVLISSAFVLTTSAYSASSFDAPKVIYGDDDRLDVYEVNDDKMLEAANATAAMIDTKSIEASKNSSSRFPWPWPRTGSRKENEIVKLIGPTLEGYGVCKAERFSQQQVVASCSGFLVGPDTLVTAGHCIKSDADCKKYSWVFGFRMKSESESQPIFAKQVYACKKIMGRDLNSSTRMDFAVIQLEKKVSGVRPLVIAKESAVVGDGLTVLGHPTGLPLKISGGAQVRADKGSFLVANLDTYGGNSGSAVINTNTYEVEGILVRGQRDYVTDSNAGCAVSNRLDNDFADAEEVSKISQIKKVLR
jgi:V8-like Glu-specific endopeptidase